MIYAVGDIHGRADLLDTLIDLIIADMGEQSEARVELVFLGDYVDRGLYSRRVIDRLIALRSSEIFDTTMLRGNHDQYLLEFMRAPETWAVWRRLGGAATLQSYGVTPPDSNADEAELAAAAAALRANISEAHMAFLKATTLMKIHGRYVFVHAGVRPGVALEDQDPRDVMSIRGAFLDVAHPAPDHLVIYGHTPVEKPAVIEGKLGIDTGAYASGVLTAVRIKDDDTLKFIQTGARR